MGFPIKKRISTSAFITEGPPVSPAPSGLDLLLGAIDSTTQLSPFTGPLSRPTRSASDATQVSSSTVEECSSSDNDEASAHSTPAKVSQAMSVKSEKASKRSKTFPEILREILSNPDYTSIVSWLPNGIYFAINDPAEFSSVILPKYFRRVIFRSFIRKLNRWGFRSVKRSVSGFESTFEHKLFTRDEPELTSKMYCKSNPTSKAAAAKTGANNGATSAQSPIQTAQQAVVSPSTSIASTVSATVSASSIMSAAAQAPPQVLPQQYLNTASASISRDEEFPLQIESELMIREIQHRRQRALMSLVQHQMPVVEADIVNQYVEEKWRLLLAQRAQKQALHQSDEYRRLTGL